MIGTAWKSHLLQILAAAQRKLLDESESIGFRIHQARRAMKECRGLIGLVPGPLRDQARKRCQSLRKVRQAVGKAREVRALLNTFDALAPEIGDAGLAIDAMRDRLSRRCLNSETAISAKRLTRVSRRILKISRRIENWNIADVPDEHFLRLAAARYKRVKRMRRALSKTFDVEGLHAFRSAVVDCGSQMHFLLGLSDGGAKLDLVRRLARLRDKLGTYIDIQLLKVELGKNPPRPVRALDVLIRERQSSALASARRIARKLPPAALIQHDAVPWK